MSGSSPHSSAAAARMESLEARRLFAAPHAAAAIPVSAPAPWGGIPRLIRQDKAFNDFATINGTGTSVAVIDTGINYDHPNLGGGFGPGFKVVGGWDFVDDDANPMDTFGHGTEVAGVIGASPFEFSGKRFQGVAQGASLLALRVDAADDPVPDARIEEALQWVIAHQDQYNIVAANISFGSGNYPGAHTSMYSDELAMLRQRGVIVAASSGNGGISPNEPFGIEYPAADPSVLSVGAVDQFDVITEYTERAAHLDLLAPGDVVPTTSLGPDDFSNPSGTSFAAPFICGTIALMRQANPGLRAADIDSIFLAGGRDNLDGDSEFGTVTNLTFPRLDVYNAVALSLARKAGALGNTGEFATAGNGNDIAYDADGVLHIVYYDAVTRDVKYLVRGTDLGVSNAMSIDSSGHDVGGYLSLAIDAHGRPAVAYFDGTGGDLRFAHFNGQTWDVETIESSGSVGLYPSLVYDGDDHAVISYFHKTRGDLRVARFNGTLWNIQTVDAKGVVGRSTSLAFNRATGELAIAYEDSDFGRLKMARNPGGGWTRGLVDPSRSGVTHTSVAFDAFNQPAVSYYDIRNADLKYACFNGSIWSQQRLANRGAQGLYTQLYFTPGGLANILYYNRKNNLVVRLTSNGTPGAFWTSTVLQSGGGRYLSLASDPTDASITYSWFEPGVAKLRVVEL
ncbi:MAG: S8 family serine peptidase [Tepidisphaeraceae bacterium]